MLKPFFFFSSQKKKKNGVIKNKRYRNALRLCDMTEWLNVLLEKL